jgi:hypothetical protein
MSEDNLIKLASVLPGAVFGASTLWLGLRQFGQSRMTARREEYLFAKSYFDDLGSGKSMHPFAKSKGLLAIAQRSDLKPEVIEHLMTYKDPLTALNYYESSLGYLKWSETGQDKLSFASKILSSRKRRQITRSALALGALLSYCLAVSTWIMWTFRLISTPLTIQLSVILFPLGIALAVIFIRQFVQLSRASRLIEGPNEFETTIDEHD